MSIRIGFIGLGHMGLPMAQRLARAGFNITGFDLSPEARLAFEQTNGKTVSELGQLFEGPVGQKVIICMIPDTAVATLLNDRKFLQLLSPETIVIEGGNSHPHLSQERSKYFGRIGVFFLDVGFAGGVEGARNGLCVMAGGNRSAYEKAEPILQALAVPNGCAWVGESGSGHFLKAFHNGLEYILIELFAELIEGLHRVGPEFGLVRPKTAYTLLQSGSIIEAPVARKVWEGYESSDLDSLAAVAGGGKFGSWLSAFALKQEVALPLLNLAVQLRFLSKTDASIQQTVAASRREIGLHPVVVK